MKKHFIKTTLITKTIPPLPIPGIILSGYVKIPFKKFFWTYMFYNVIYAIIFVSLGYYSGFAVNTVLHYLKLGEYIFLASLITFLIFYLITKGIIKRYSVDSKISY